MNTEFQYGTWIPSLQIGNGVIAGQYTDRIGNWTRVGHQIFVNAFFRLNYNQQDVQEAVRRNTTVQEMRIGTLPFESNSGASIFNLMVSNNSFIQNNRQRFSNIDNKYIQTEILSLGARSIWGSPRMRVFATERSVLDNRNSNITQINQTPLAVDLNLQDIKPSTNGIFVEVRVSGVYTAFADLSTTDPVNTPPPTIINPSTVHG